ncbi:DSBA oxidoreductase [Alteracholeplasma palmae J233]|uniref:DSBA oxidoreductase n=1 Tax=Alteracholeplasma palmae (strain ATCC 49389 / J233) TaxID=1318466 RepID=U4KRI1_ALTPJ|nr:DsbA family protein [Alteracholeplasma palmae]CCV64186.1 DSBA oxidoreductase [Alteracholeplasma palmae J233]
MRIDVWMDFNCPQSYISIKRLIKTVEAFKFNEEIEIVYRSYEQEDRKDALSKIDEDDLNKLNIKLDNIKPIKTQLPHQMLHLGKKNKCQQEVLLKLFKARFEENKDISNKEVLKEVLKDLLKEQEIEKTISELTFKNAIELNKENAIRRNITKLPHYRFNHTVDLEENPTIETFKKAIVTMYQKETNTTYCEDDNCYR